MKITKKSHTKKSHVTQVLNSLHCLSCPCLTHLVKVNGCVNRHWTTPFLSYEKTFNFASFTQ